MADRMSTSTRMDRARANQKISRRDNGHLKQKERAAREVRMVELIKTGRFPFTPSIASWISGKLGKPFTQVTEAEAQGLAK